MGRKESSVDTSLVPAPANAGCSDSGVRFSANFGCIVSFLNAMASTSLAFCPSIMKHLTRAVGEAPDMRTDGDPNDIRCRLHSLIMRLTKA